MPTLIIFRREVGQYLTSPFAYLIAAAVLVLTGVLFNRDAWVGVTSAELGKLTFGRQNAIGRDPIASAIYGDPYGPAAPSLEEGGYSNNNNFKQLIFYAGSASGTRLNNGVVWKKGFDNGLFGGAFNVAGFATAAKVAAQTNHAYSIGGNYTVGPVRLNAGLFHYTAQQAALGDRKDNAYTVSAKLAPAGSSLDYELGYQNMKATATGSRATLYASTIYHFDKITEVYLAGDYLKLKDGYKVGATNGFPSQTEIALGLRTRF